MATDTDTRLSRSRSGDLIVETGKPFAPEELAQNQNSPTPAKPLAPHIDQTSVARMSRVVNDELMAGVKPEEFDARFERVQNMTKSGEIEVMARKRIAQEQADYLKGKPGIISSPQAVYSDDPYREAITDQNLLGKIRHEAKEAQTLFDGETMKDAVAQALKIKHPDMPDHLARGLGQTYATALRIDDDEELARTGQRRNIHTRPRLGHLSRSLASAVTRHIRGDNPVHDLDDLRGDIRRVLSDGTRYAPKDPGQIAKAAREIARQRHINGIKIDVVGKVLKDNGVREAGNGYYVTRAVHNNQNPFEDVLPKLAPKFDAELQAWIEGMKPTDFKPDEADKAIARATAFLPASYPDQGKHVAKVIVRAAAARALPEAEEIRRERKELINDLTNWNAFGEDKQKAAVERLYNAFTHKEIEQLSDPQSALSRSIPALPQQPQGFRAGLMDLFRADTSLSRPWSNRHDELSKDITRGTERDCGYEMD